MDYKEGLQILKEKYSNNKIELNKVYYVSEWSWSPMLEGYIVAEETIRHAKPIDGLAVFTTGKNNRHYFKWDIHETKEEADKVSKFKNQFGYEWNMNNENFIDTEKLSGMLLSY